MEHLHNRIPYARCHRLLLCQLFPSNDTSKLSLLSRGVHTSSANASQAKPKTTVKNRKKRKPKANDATLPTIPPSQQLPQSPLIANPHPGRQIRHRKKRQPTREDVSELEKNPWAVALASPIRMCMATGSRLPKALLTEWGVVEEPAPATATATDEKATEAEASKAENDRRLWLMPQGLMTEYLNAPEGYEQEKDLSHPQLQFRMLDRPQVYEQITKADNIPIKRSKGGQKSPVVTQLLPFRWKRPVGPLTARDELRVFWRADMVDFVLKMKRQDALKQVKLATDKKNMLLRSFDVQGPYTEETFLQGLMTEALERRETVDKLETGVFLVLGESSGSNPNADAGVAPVMPEFVTLQNGRKVAVLDLRRRFSSAQLDELRAHHKQFQKFVVFMRPVGDFGVNAVLALWNLDAWFRESSAKLKFMY